MRIRSFESWRDGADRCSSCGELHWGDADRCDDCRDAELEREEEGPTPPTTRPGPTLPKFGVPTTKSQNIYYL